MIIFIGLSNIKVDYAGLIVNWALVSLGSIVIVIAIATIVALAYNDVTTQMIVLFLAIVSSGMLLVFGIGAIFFNDNLLQWIDEHWDIL